MEVDELFLPACVHSDASQSIMGVASGMGLAMATRFAGEGASVVAGGWNAERLNTAVTNIQAGGGAIVGAQGYTVDQARYGLRTSIAVLEASSCDVCYLRITRGSA